MDSPYLSRLARLRTWMSTAGLDWLVVGHLPNVRYLCGFTGSAGVFGVSGTRACLFTDSRYTFQAHAEVAGARVQIVRGDLFAAVGKWISRQGRPRVGFESHQISVAGKRRLAEAAGPGVRWHGVQNSIEQFRRVKDAAEIAAMREAAGLASQVFEEILPLVRPGVRETELAAEIEYRMRRKGASGAAFETIVAFGERTALPHARPSTRALRKNELVLFDWGAILRGYCCDVTRTVFVGRAPARILGWHRAVLEAQQAAQETLRPGVAAAEVDAAARVVLARRKLARYVMHSTGHGLGLEIHEEPRLARGQKGKIQAGNVVTVEPGVYREGLGGIRIEDDVVVSSTGNEVLTTANRALLQL